MGPNKTGQIPVTSPGEGKMLFHWACFSSFSKFPHKNMCQLQQSLSFKYFADLIFFSFNSGTQPVLLKCTFYSYGRVFSQPLKQTNKSQVSWLLFPNLFLFQVVNGSVLVYKAVDRNPYSYLPQRGLVNSETSLMVAKQQECCG